SRRGTAYRPRPRSRLTAATPGWVNHDPSVFAGRPFPAAAGALRPPAAAADAPSALVDRAAAAPVAPRAPAARPPGAPAALAAPPTFGPMGPAVWDSGSRRSSGGIGGRR